jgi:hypothetical protein
MSDTCALNPMVTIQLGGKERHLLITMNSLIAIEEKTGRNVLEGDIIPEKMALKDVRLLVWAGLLHEEPNLTLEEAGAMIRLDSLATLAAALGTAIKAALPESKGDSAESGDRPLVQ